MFDVNVVPMLNARVVRSAYRRNGKVVKDLTTVLPSVGIAILLLALVCPHTHERKQRPKRVAH